jgi:hypothetical protein
MYVALALVKFSIVQDPTWSGAMMNRTKFHFSGENISVETHRWQRASPNKFCTQSRSAARALRLLRERAITVGSKLLGATWLGRLQGRKSCASARLERRSTAEAAAGSGVGGGGDDEDGRDGGPFLAPYDRIRSMGLWAR